MTHEIQDSKYQGFYIDYPSRNQAHYTVSTKSNSSQHFKFRKEGYIDKFFKFIGFSKEFQLNNSEFDHNIYILSDCQSFRTDLYQCEKVQQLILELFNLNIRTLECNNQKLFVTFKKMPKEYKDGWFSKGNFQQYIDKIIDIITNINNCLVDFPSSSLEADPIIKKWIKYIKFIILSSISGVLIYFIDFCSYTERIVDDGLLKESLYYSVIVFLVYLFKCTSEFLQTSRAHIVLGINLVFALPTFIMWGYLTLLYTNIFFDNSNHEVYFRNVIKKEKHHRSKGGTTYKVTIPNFKQQEKEYTLVSSKDLYNFVKVGSEIILTVKKGYLGYSWVVKEENIVANFMGNINFDDVAQGIKPASIPATWLKKELTDNRGFCWYDPKHPGDMIVFYKNNKPIPEKQILFAYIFKDGLAIDKFGKKILGSSLPNDLRIP